LDNNYEIFVSYAHGDDDQGFIASCVDRIETVFRKKTGDNPKIFIDHTDIMTSDIWESKISNGLNNSMILLSFVSPLYIQSEWCLKEYDEFVSREERCRESRNLPKYSGIVFPVLLHSLERGRFSSEQELFKDSLLKRQYFDFSSQAFRSSVKENNVVELVEQLIDSIDDIERLSNSAFNKLDKNDITICDYKNKLMWNGEISKYEMDFDEANEYVTSLRTGGFKDWRLPTLNEVKTGIDEENLPKDPKGSTYPFHEPFNVRRSGRIFTSTIIHSPVSGKQGYYVVNLRNAHCFNGSGESAYIRAVRDIT